MKNVIEHNSARISLVVTTSLNIAITWKMLDYLSIAFFTFSRVLLRVFVISEQINLPCIK